MSMKNNPLIHHCAAPFDPEVQLYGHWQEGDPEAVHLFPYWYTNWMDETLSWKKDCYLHTFLSGGAPSVRLKGREAEKLMSDTFVNSVTLDRFHVGQCKHVIALTREGYIATHGVALRVAEDEFNLYTGDEYVYMKMKTGGYDIEDYEIAYEQDFIFQLAGPRSLELVENVVKEDVHHLKFMRFCSVNVLGSQVRLLRMGMGRTLAYELHGKIEDMEKVYNEILRVGKAYNLHQMGHLAYMSNHTENGFPQEGIHFMNARAEDPDMRKFYNLPDPEEKDYKALGIDLNGVSLRGSMNDQGYKAYYMDPLAAGWGRFIDWNHDFQGKEALKVMRDDPNHPVVCTLEWNHEDIMKIFNAYYDDEPGVPDQMMFPQNLPANCFGQTADKVLNENGELIGKSACVVYTLYYKKSISMAFLDPDYVKEGQEVMVLWGRTGTRQIPIRAKVARFPYLSLADNRDFDMETIPHYKG